MSVYYNGKEVSEVVYGTGDTGKLNFKAIGYEDVPEPLKDGLEYAKEIKDNWDSSKTSLYDYFKGDYKLVYFPPVDISKVENMSYCFQNCYSLTTIPELNTSKVRNMAYCFEYCYSLKNIPQLDTSNVTSLRNCFFYCKTLTSISLLNSSKVTDMYQCFQGCSSLTEIHNLNTSSVTNMYKCFSDCSNLTTIPLLNTSNVTDMSYCFQNCSSLTEIPELDTSKVTNFSRFVDISGGKNLKRINGLSFKSMPSFTSTGLITYYTNESCRYVLIKDIGTQSGCTKLVIKELRGWGINSDEIPDARQSLIDSLLTYSFDRRAAGYSDCTIQLYKDVKAVLTEEELAAIQAKGYIITT